MVQKNHRNISVHDDTYETLKHMGAVTESFDSVVRKLIEKAAMSDPTLGGRGQSIAAAPLQTPTQAGGQNG